MTAEVGVRGLPQYGYHDYLNFSLLPRMAYKQAMTDILEHNLVEKVLGYDPKADGTLLERAFDYASDAHRHQTRKSGDPYISHPLAVAEILIDLKLDDATIAAALLHDTIEDTDATVDDIRELFGEEICVLVEGLTKIDKLDLVTKKAEQAENFRKLLLAISSDIRVLLVKFADRLHNMRTLEHMKPGSRERIARETLDIYGPLAGRMGIQWMREELEELAFKWLYPEQHAAVLAKLEEMKDENQSLIEEIKSAIQARLDDSSFDGVVSGREKKPYSIWRKMEHHQISLEKLSDIFGFRVITQSVEDCYRALGIAHTSWRAVPGRMKDYISTPKQNGYQSIHTTVVGPGNHRVEMQIRTDKMHQIAEHGVAAHALYKDSVEIEAGGENEGGPSNPYLWLRHLVDTLLEGDNPEEFLENTKLELFHDQVFCFTPKGLLIALPQGATPIDFAYAVHTDIGNSCVGAKINGRHVPLVTKLANGDEVQIIRSDAQKPPAVWEKLVITGKARSAIRRATRKAVRTQFSELGRQLVETAAKAAKKEYDDRLLEKSLHRLSQATVIDALAAVGRRELRASDILRAIFPKDALPEQKQAARTQRNRLEIAGAAGQSEEGWFNLSKVIGFKFRIPRGQNADPGGALAGIPVRGLKGDIPVEFAEGGAIPGDRIVGILTDGKGVRIYPIHSPKLAEFDEQLDRWVDVTWDIDERIPERYPVEIAVTALNEPGSLAGIAQLIGDEEGNIDNISMVDRAADFTIMHIMLEVWDTDHLNRIITGLKGQKSVNLVERIYS